MTSPNDGCEGDYSYLGVLVTCTGDREICPISGRLLDNPGELAYMHRRESHTCKVKISISCLLTARPTLNRVGGDRRVEAREKRDRRQEKGGREVGLPRWQEPGEIPQHYVSQ